MLTLSITFDLNIKPQQIYDFRGAMGGFVKKYSAVKGLSTEEEELFHNHNDEDDSHIHRYSKIQYRYDKGKAAIWAVNEGVTALEKILTKEGNLPDFEMNGKLTPLKKTDRDKQDFTPAITNEWNYYYLKHFVPFNRDNFNEYKDIITYRGKIGKIEEIIERQIKSLKDIEEDWILNEQIKVELCDIKKMTPASIKTKDKKGEFIKIRRNSYYLKIRSNAKLPIGCSLGLHKAYGYGIVQHAKVDDVL